MSVIAQVTEIVGLLTDPSHAIKVSTKTYTVVRSRWYTFTSGV